MTRLRLLLPLVLMTLLSACAAQSVWAPDDVVAKSSYSYSGPPSITLVTVINNRTGEGGHSAIIINARERIIFDPAGNFESSAVPERNDVLFGISPAALRSYYGFHARKAWHVVTQTIEVTPEVAEAAYRYALENGAVAPGFCAINTTGLLRKLPQFKDMPSTFFPRTAMAAFARYPGVKTDKIYEYD